MVFYIHWIQCAESPSDDQNLADCRSCKHFYSKAPPHRHATFHQQGFKVLRLRISCDVGHEKTRNH